MVEEAEAVVPHSDSPPDAITSETESGVCQSATDTETNEHSVRHTHILIAHATSTDQTHSRTTMSIPMSAENSYSLKFPSY